MNKCTKTDTKNRANNLRATIFAIAKLMELQYV